MGDRFLGSVIAARASFVATVIARFLAFTGTRIRRITCGCFRGFAFCCRCWGRTGGDNLLAVSTWRTVGGLGDLLLAFPQFTNSR
jgi:hypothetical protein